MNERDWRRDQIEQSAFDHLMESDPAYYRRVSKYLAHIAAHLGVPPSEIWDVVEETWLEAVKHRHLFSDKDIERCLVCWLSKVVRGKAVDAQRRLSRNPYESLATVEGKWIAADETLHAGTSEKITQLNSLLVRLQREEPENGWLVWEHYWKRRTISELAEETGRTANEVRCRVYRGVERIRLWPYNFCFCEESGS